MSRDQPQHPFPRGVGRRIVVAAEEPETLRPVAVDQTADRIVRVVRPNAPWYATFHASPALPVAAVRGRRRKSPPAPLPAGRLSVRRARVMVARMAGRDVLGRTWFDQACADLAAAEDSAATGHHEWACFQAQQAGGEGAEGGSPRPRADEHPHQQRAPSRPRLRRGRRRVQGPGRRCALARSALHSDALPERARCRADAVGLLRSEGFGTMSAVCSLDPRSRRDVLRELRFAAGRYASSASVAVSRR